MLPAELGAVAVKVRRYPFLILCLIVVAAPFLSVQFAPLADLPQQVAQIRLALGAGQPESQIQVQWLAPNRLSYPLLYAVWAVVDPLDVGRIAMMLIGLLWVASFHALAAHRNRPLEAAVLASLLFFNHFVYWGFYNFAVGVPVFLLWVALLSLPAVPAKRAQHAASLCATALLLLYAHALLLAAGLAWFALRHLLFRIPFRELVWRSVSIAPAVALAAPTFVSTRRTLAAAGISADVSWKTPLFERLHPSWLVDQAFGALADPIEALVCAFLLIWVAGGLWQQRRNLRAATDLELLAAGGMCALFTFALPHKYANTIYFAERWFPLAVVFLVLSLPAPRLPWRLHLVAANAILLLFCAVTTLHWWEIERTDFSGLSASLAALPPEPRVLGLDYLKSSPRLKINRPFLQTFAYAQVAKGGELNFSFAQHPSSLAVFRQPYRPPWTPGLDWYAERVRARDLKHFTHLLVGGNEASHAAMATQPALKALTTDGVWRLYQVRG